jgi:MTH538 TIR-like domain (DUF1863)
MAVPRAFISFDFDHNEDEKNLFVGQGKHPDTPWEISDWSSKSVLPQSQWEKLIEAKINRCNMVIVLIGKNMAGATGVTKEIKMAKDNNVPIFGVYVDGANSNSNLPYGLAKNRTVPWTWPNVAAGVKQMMKEGKNA